MINIQERNAYEKLVRDHVDFTDKTVRKYVIESFDNEEKMITVLESVTKNLIEDLDKAGSDSSKLKQYYENVLKMEALVSKSKNTIYKHSGVNDMLSTCKSLYKTLDKEYKNSTLVGKVLTAILTIMFKITSVVYIGCVLTGYATYNITTLPFNAFHDMFNKIHESTKDIRGKNAMRESMELPVDESSLVLAGVGILIVTQAIPLIRELIYYFHYLKISASDILKNSSDAIAVHALELEKEKSKSDKDIKSISEKQKAIAEKLMKFANKLGNTDNVLVVARKNSKVNGFDNKIVEDIKKGAESETLGLLI